MSGGTLSVVGINGQTSGTSAFNFDGGTVAASSSNGTFFGNFGNVFTLNVRNGGAIINTNTFNDTIPLPLVHSTIGGDNATDGGLTKLGLGTLTVSATNTYTGNTVVSVGALDATLKGSLPGYATANKISVASGATLILGVGGTGQFASADVDTVRTSQTFASLANIGFDTGSSTNGFAYATNISGATGLVKVGNNTLTLSGSNTYSGVTLAEGGTLALTGSLIQSASVFGVGAGTTTFNGTTGTVTVSTGAVVTENGYTAIGGSAVASGSYIGTGTLTINGGTVNVGPNLGGSVTLDGTAGLDATHLWLDPYGGSGSTLNLNGGTLSIARPIANGSATPATLNWNGGTLQAAGAGVNLIDLIGPLTVNVQAGGAIANSNGLSTAIFEPLLHGTVAPLDGGLTLNGSGITGGVALDAANTYTGVTTINGGDNNLAVAETAGTSGPLGKSAATNPGSIVFNGGAISFSAANTFDYSGRFSTAANQAIGIDTNAQNVTFATGLTSSGGSLVKYSTGTLTLSGSNTYTGFTFVRNGTLALTGPLTNTGSFYVANLGAATFSSTFTQSALQAFSVGSGVVIATGSSAGTFAGGGNIDTVNAGANLTLNGYIAVGGAGNSGGAAGFGTFTINGGTVNVGPAAATTLDGTHFWLNPYGAGGTSTLNLNGGTLSLQRPIATGSSSGVINFNGGTLQAAASISLIDSSSQVADVLAGGAIVNSNGFTASINQALVHGSGTPDGGLTKIGSGTITLTGASTYNGPTTLSAGVLNAGVAETAGTSGPFGNSAAANPGSIVLAGGTLQFSSVNHNDYSGRFSTAANQAYNIDTNGQAVTFATALTSSGGTLLKLGSGTLTLTGANSYTGVSTLSAGTLQIGSGGTAGSLGSGSVVDNATLAYNLSSSPTVSNVISGSGAFAQIGTGTTTLSGSNSYTGTTVVSAGVLAAGVTSVGGVSGAFGNNSAVTLVNVAGAVLNITGFDTQIGSLTGGGTTGGNVILGAATLKVGGDNSTPAAYGGYISGGGGGLTKIGTGTLTLSGASNSYTGNVIVSGGTLVAANAVGGTNPTVSSLGNPQTAGRQIIVNSGATLSFTAHDVLGNAGKRTGGCDNCQRWYRPQQRPSHDVRAAYAQWGHAHRHEYLWV